MDIRPVNAAKSPGVKPGVKKRKSNRPGDEFVKTGKSMAKIGLSADDISRILLNENTKDAMKEAKDKKAFVKKIHRQIEMAMPELKELEKQGVMDAETAKNILCSSADDPHIHKSTEVGGEGELRNRPIVREDGTFVIPTGSFTKYLTAYSSTGDVLWKGEHICDKQPVEDLQGNLYFAKNNNTASYTPDGKLRWKMDRMNQADGYKEYKDSEFHSGDCSGASGEPAIDEKRGNVYFGEWYGKIFCLDKDSGKVKWCRWRPGMIGDNSPALDKQGNIFMHDDNGYAMSLKPNGEANWIVGVGYPGYYPKGDKTLDDPGSKKWMKEVGLSRREYDYKDGDNFAIGASQIIVGDDEKIILGARDGRLIALNHDTGQMDSFFDAKDAIYNTPVDAGNGRVVFNNSEGKVFCVDTAKTIKGKYGNEMPLLWKKQYDKNANVETVDANGRVYVNTEKGLIVHNSDGSVAWQTAVKPRGMTITDDGRLIAAEKGRILELKPLAERVEELKKQGDLAAKEADAGLEKKEKTIEETDNAVIIDGVSLEKRKFDHLGRVGG